MITTYTARAFCPHVWKLAVSDDGSVTATMFGQQVWQRGRCVQRCRFTV